MRQDDSPRRFRARLTREGTIAVPAEASAGLRAGQALMVEISATGAGNGSVPHDEREIAAIAVMQSESPDLVRRCLGAQGALAVRRPRRIRRR